MSPYRERASACRVCAVVVAYHPDALFLDRLADIEAQVETVVVVDNTPGGATTLRTPNLHRDFVVLGAGGNVGVARALNMGCEWACERGYSWVLTMDQDSRVGPAMVETMVDAALRRTDLARVAVLAPVADLGATRGAPALFLRRRPGSLFCFERVVVRPGEVSPVSIVISSGSLLSMRAFRALGGLCDDLFIDYVDTEYCLRCNAAGYRVLVVGSATMSHRLGDKHEVTVLGRTFAPTFHDPRRLYYIARNRVHMYRWYAAKFPHWLAFDLVAGGYNLVRVLLAEPGKRAKVWAMVRGTVDGLRGCTGVANPIEL